MLLAKCGVVLLSVFRGEYLNVNVLRRTTDDGRTDAKMTTAHMVIGQLTWTIIISLLILFLLTDIVRYNQMSDML